VNNKTKPCIVYIVDDDDLVRKGFARLMRASGFVPKVYDSPEIFLREVGAESPAFSPHAPSARVAAIAATVVSLCRGMKFPSLFDELRRTTAWSHCAAPD